jgi:hypothetical protein
MPRRIEIGGATKNGIALAIAAICVGGVGALFVVGRGSDDDVLRAARRIGVAQDGSSDAHAAREDEFDAFRDCVEKHGASSTEQGRLGEPPSEERDDELRDAFDACRQYLAPGLLPGPGRFGPRGGGEDHRFGEPRPGRDDGGAEDTF